MSVYLFGDTGFNWIIFIIGPFKPSAVIDRNTGPSHQPSIQEGFTTTPSRTAIESIVLVRCNTYVCPEFLYLMILPRRVIEIPIIFHMISITTAVPEYRSRNTALFQNVVITTYLTDVLPPATYTDKVAINGFK